MKLKQERAFTVMTVCYEPGMWLTHFLAAKVQMTKESHALLFGN